MAINKYTILIVISTFWIVIGIGIQFLNVSGFTPINVDSWETTSEKPTLSSYIGIVWTLWNNFSVFMLLGLPNAPKLINVFLWIFKIASLIVVISVFRGGGD